MSLRTIFFLAVFATALLLASGARGEVVFSQPPDPAGGIYHSSWWDPNGSDYDQYVWDGFVLDTATAITEVDWRGAYDPGYFGSGGPVVDFTVEIWSSIAGGSQPDIGSVFATNPLVQYTVGGNAGETPAGTFGGVAMYDYQFTLPVPFQAQAGEKYWVQIEAWQHGIPDWSMAVGTNGDGWYFRRIANVGDIFYQLVPGAAAFTLKNAVDPATIGTAPVSSFSLLGPRPNPVRGDRHDVWFSLPSAGPARLELYNVFGSRLAAVEVGSLGPGCHAVDPAPGRPLSAGVYFLRLTKGSLSQHRRMTVIE